jgi:hypothetical protein
MEVFSLMPGQDHPLYGRLSFGLQPSLFGNEFLFEDFQGVDVGKLSWTPNRFSDVWTAKQARGPASIYNDYPADGSLVSFYSPRAVEALREFLEPNGELLPVGTKVGTYFAYNILTKSTALDLSRTKARFGEPGDGEKETAFSIDRFEFDEAKLAEHAVFRLREYPPAVYVTDVFKRRAESAGLRGMFFYKVWPLSPDEDWVTLRKQQWKRIKAETAPLKANSVIIRLQVAKKQASESETEAVEEIAADLAEHLAVEHNKTIEDFVGMVVPIDETRGALRIGLVTPNADRLAEIVSPWILAADWPGGIELIKHYGDIHDNSAKHRKVKIR